MADSSTGSKQCIGQQVRLFRAVKDWSQLKLAETAGLSKRVIVKAEAGGRLSADSISRIAAALSRSDRVVRPGDLTTDVKGLARTFINALYAKQSEMAGAIASFTHRDAVFNFVREPGSVPFAGTHRGIEGFDKAIRTFFAIYEVPSDRKRVSRYQFYLRETDVVIWGKSWIQPNGVSLVEPTPVSVLLQFRDGKLVSMEDRCGFNEQATGVKKSHVPGKPKVASKISYEGSSSSLDISLG